MSFRRRSLISCGRRDLSEEAPSIRGVLAQVYRRLGDQEAALRENRLASQVTETIAINDPKAFGPNRALGQLLVRRERYAEAIPYLRRALEARPDSGPVHLSLGIALAASGDFASAWTAVKRAERLGDFVPPGLLDGLRKRFNKETR